MIIFFGTGKFIDLQFLLIIFGKVTPETLAEEYERAVMAAHDSTFLIEKSSIQL
jgi:hypothetical protein